VGKVPDLRNRDPHLRSVEHRPVVVARRPRQQRARALLHLAVLDVSAIHDHANRFREIHGVRRQEQREGAYAACLGLERVSFPHHIHTT
jgi:hypothetical protein